jgi:hypothetical protein
MTYRVCWINFEGQLDWTEHSSIRSAARHAAYFASLGEGPVWVE